MTCSEKNRTTSTSALVDVTPPVEVELREATEARRETAASLDFQFAAGAELYCYRIQD